MYLYHIASKSAAHILHLDKNKYILYTTSIMIKYKLVERVKYTSDICYVCAE